MTEEFKDIKGFEGLYQVSNLGRIKSLKCNREKILKPCLVGIGYLSVSLCKEGKTLSKNIHQLAAIAFLGHTPNGHKIVVDHIDNDKTNNRVDNLQLITTRENNSKDKKGCSSKYTGVYWYKSSNRWTAQIRINGKVKHLGVFTDELDASKAYQDALRAM